MKKLCFLSFMIILLFQGCIEIKTLINVNNDGSGTIEETLVMSGKALEMIRGFSSAFSSDSAEQQDFNLFDENNLKEQAVSFGKGVVYVSGEKIQDGGKEGFKAIYSFRNLADVSINKIPRNEIPLNIPEAQNNLSFKFLKGSPSEIIVTIPETEDSSGQNEVQKDSGSGFESSDSLGSDSAYTNEALDLVKDLSISLILHINGSIVETNASYPEGREVTLVQFDFSKLLDNRENLNELFKLKTQNLDEIKRIVKNIPGIKIETSKEIFIKFQ